MISASKHVVFDVVGTLVGYESLTNAINARLGDSLRAQGVKPTLLGEIWIEVAEREYTYLSMSGKYVPFDEIFEAIFFRMLWKAGISEPRHFASKEDLDFIMDGYRRLSMRPGAKECIQKLRDAGFTVWGLTAGDLDGVRSFFDAAAIEMPQGNLSSCDASGVGKPDPEAYKPLLKRLTHDDHAPWFAAAHMWDVSAAKRTGYHGAYCTVFEHEALTELFGEMDVVADSLSEMADMIISATK